MTTLGLGVFLTVLLVSCALTWLASQQGQKELVKSLKGLLDVQREQQSELLNRIQASDLKTFVALQHNSVTGIPGAEMDTMPRTDAAELARMAEMYGEVEGIGDTIYTDEEMEMFSSIPGFNLDGEVR